MVWHMWLWYEYTSNWFGKFISEVNLRSFTLLLSNIEDLSIWFKHISGSIALYFQISQNIWIYLPHIAYIVECWYINKQNPWMYKIYLDQLPFIAKQIECRNINMQNILTIYCMMSLVYEIYLDQLPYIAKQTECWNIKIAKYLDIILHDVADIWNIPGPIASSLPTLLTNRRLNPIVAPLKVHSLNSLRNFHMHILIWLYSSHWIPKVKSSFEIILHSLWIFSKILKMHIDNFTTSVKHLKPVPLVMPEYYKLVFQMRETTKHQQI